MNYKYKIKELESKINPKLNTMVHRYDVEGKCDKPVNATLTIEINGEDSKFPKWVVPIEIRLINNPDGIAKAIHSITNKLGIESSPESDLILG